MKTMRFIVHIPGLIFNARSWKDCWSFGVLLWEIVTLGELPNPDVGGLANFLTFLGRGGRLRKPLHCSQELYDIMLRCWDNSPDMRPTFEQLWATLQKILQDKERTYINVTFVPGGMPSILKEPFQRHISSETRSAQRTGDGSSLGSSARVGYPI